jgi:hypothetical protein
MFVPFFVSKHHSLPYMLSLMVGKLHGRHRSANRFSDQVTQWGGGDWGSMNSNFPFESSELYYPCFFFHHKTDNKWHVSESRIDDIIRRYCLPYFFQLFSPLALFPTFIALNTWSNATKMIASPHPSPPPISIDMSTKEKVTLNKNT